MERQGNVFRKRNHRLRHWVPAKLGPARIALRSLFQQHVLVRGRQNTTGLAHIFHCCTGKTGSQWLMSVLSDTQVVLRAGMYHYHYQSRRHLGPDPRPIRDREFTEPFPAGAIVTPVFVRYSKFRRTPMQGDYRAFFVFRDPRELLVSWYFSTKTGHVASPHLNPEMVAAREKLHALTQEAGLSWSIDEIVRRGHFQAMSEWLDAEDPRVQLFRYEDLAGPEGYRTFARLLSFLNIRLTEDELGKLLAAYSFERLSGRKRGAIDEKSHLRAGGASTWSRYLTAGHLRALEGVFNRERLVRLGYEW